MVLDIRHLPTKDDHIMYNYIIQSKIPFICITNKADKIAKTKINDAVKDVQLALNPLCDIAFLSFSSKDRTHVDSIWELLETLI